MNTSVIGIEKNASITATLSESDDHVLHDLTCNGEKVLSISVYSKDVDGFHSYIMNRWGLSPADKVRQFTQESAGKECPSTPQLMTKESAVFITKMVLSEMAELLQTVCETPDEVLKLMHECVGKDFNMEYKKADDSVSLIAEQADAMVDAQYYMLNTAAKHGMNLQKMFEVVHQANMAKKWSDGKFHRREDDGKVIKSPEWKEPNITEEISRQIREGW